jgi:hypothetical protein
MAIIKTSTVTYRLTLQNESSSFSSHDLSCLKGKIGQENCEAQAQSTSLHVLLVWYMSSKTMAFKRLKRFD